jgi:spore germination cell wall hydrolase CwlJ-like protein
MHESRNQSTTGITWVASVIINRTKHKNFPSSICDVVLQPKQFTDVHKAFKASTTHSNTAGYIKVTTVAYNALYGDLSLPRGILYYHTKAIKPKWSTKMKKVAVVQDHVFYTTK